MKATTIIGSVLLATTVLAAGLSLKDSSSKSASKSEGSHKSKKSDGSSKSKSSGSSDSKSSGSSKSKSSGSSKSSKSKGAANINGAHVGAGALAAAGLLLI